MIRLGRGSRGLRAALVRARRFRSDEGGATAIEYALVAGVFFCVIIGSLRLFGDKLNSLYVRIGSNVANIN